MAFLVFHNRVLLSEREYTMSGSPAMPTFDVSPIKEWIGNIHGDSIGCSQQSCHVVPESTVGERLVIVDLSDGSKREYDWNGSSWVQQ